MTDKTLTEREDEIYIQLYKIKDLADEINSYVTELLSEDYNENPERPRSFKVALEDFIDLAKDIYGYSSVFADYIIGEYDDLPIDPTKDPVECPEEEISGILFKRLTYFRKVLLKIYYHYDNARDKLYVPVRDGETAAVEDPTLDNEINKTIGDLYDITRLQMDILNFLRPGPDKKEACKKCK